MRFCKYCKKPILNNDVWNPDHEGNGYHHACLCDMEFRSRAKKIYDKGRADILDKIRTELHATAEMHEDGDYYLRDEWIDEIIDKYKAESEGEENRAKNT